jgi:hypothetical protein
LFNFQGSIPAPFPGAACPSLEAACLSYQILYHLSTPFLKKIAEISEIFFAAFFTHNILSFLHRHTQFTFGFSCISYPNQGNLFIKSKQTEM